jgi:hypothetical protein
MQHVGFDKRGRALVFSDIGLARDKAPSTNAEHCMQVLELLEPSLAPFPNDQYIWVVEFKHFSMADMNPSVAGACLSLFGRSYPERLGGMIMVGAPMLFNGLYRAVAAFADPVTVKKVRFVTGPDGRGGGKPIGPVLAEFFDEETAAWLIAEMTENRRRWKDLARRKSWLAATAAGDGTRHGWWEGGGTNVSSSSKNDTEAAAVYQGGHGAKTRAQTLGAAAAAGGVVSEDGHDIRGCPSFIRSAACARMCRIAREHVRVGKLTRGAVSAAADANATSAPAAPPADADESEEEEFYDAVDH